MILQLLLQVLILLLPRPVISMASAPPPPPPPLSTKPNCPSTCGNNVTIPFPFGIGGNCYLDKSYAVECKASKPLLRSIGLEVLQFSLQQSTMTINQPVVSSCQDKPEEARMVSLENLPFYFSYDYNYLTGIGCNNLALMSSAFVDDFTLGGCFSICNSKNKTEDKYCSDGIGCCQNEIPSGLKSLNISVSSINNGTGSRSQQQDCKYAFLVEYDWFVQNFNSSKDVQNWNQVPVALDWRIYNSSYENLALSKSSTSGSTFDCDTDDSGLMRCYCLGGYKGNPYLFQDVNECELGIADICKSNRICENYIGGYSCIHPKKPKVYVIFLDIGTGIGALFLVVGAWWLGIKIRKKMKQKEENFKRNGGLLLQQQLNSLHDDIDRCKIFNSRELDKATDHFSVNRILGQGGQGTVYKGMLADGRIIAVKRSKIVDEAKLEEFINEVVILSQINHRNVVKLLGCCLETEFPLLVYEFIPNGTLFQYLHNQNEEFPFIWDIRLRIATEIAEALSYLHSAAYLPVYHRDIKSTNILLDEKYRAKIADFGTSKSIAIDQTHVSTKIQGTFGYLDPEYFHSSQFTDKSDVYSFGVVVLELLTGKKPIPSILAEEGRNLATYFLISMDENCLLDILDGQVRQTGKKEEILAVANVARKCLNPQGKSRPTMKEVAMELERIRSSRNNSNVQKSSKQVDLTTEVIELWDIVST
ncbi:putative Kinase [Melia azedarach]|uniref:Kinase n=1 Tax=Melia azedarach TaxID=155640 RepID=A0ACC1Y2U5_MELAZ|nr:putative Kinase [Melia azedarach]